MAYFVDSAQTNGTAGIAAVAQNIPPHEINDILVAVVTVDSGTATFGGSAWIDIPSAPANPITSGTIVYLKYFKATSTSSTMTLTTADAFTTGIYVFRNVDGTTPFDGVTPSFAAVAASSTPTTAAITSTTADCLVFYAIALDGTTPQVLSDPGVMFIDGFDATGTTATTSSHQSAAWYVQRTAGAVPVSNWVADQSAAYVRITVVMRNASGGRIPAYIDDVTSPGTRFTPGHHISTLNNISYTAAGAGSLTGNVNSKTTTVTAAVNGADFGINVYANAVTSAAAATAATALAGPELVLTAGRNASTGLIMGTIVAGTPKMGAFGIGTIAQGGCVIRIGSAATFWNAYQVSARNSQPAPDQRCLWAIQAGYSGSQYGTAGSGGSANAAAITHIQFLRNAPSFSSQTYNSEIHLVATQIIAGGDATTPVDIAGLIEVGKSFRLPIIQKAGANGAVSFAPIQIGGGDAVNFQVDAGALQFPRRATQASKELAFHAADNAVGISFSAKSGDTCKFTNSVITSPTPYFFTINVAATSAATWDFNGLVLVNATTTLRNVTTFNGLSFTSCPSITVSDCALTGCSIGKPPATSGSFIVNSATTVSSSTINVTTLTAGNYWTTTTTPAIFSSCAFTGSATAGHAIRITTPGTYSFSGNTFTSFGATGTTSAAIYNDSGGAVVLNITGGGGTPTYRNGAGASTTVNNAVTLSVTIKNAAGTAIQNARVAIYKSSDNSVILNALTDVSGLVSIAYAYIGDESIYIRARKTTTGTTRYINNDSSGTITASGFSATVTLLTDIIASA